MAGQGRPGWFGQHLADMVGLAQELDGWPLYGLDGWCGPRMLGGWSLEDGVLVTLALAHGELGTASPFVQVHLTTRDPREVVAELRLSAAASHSTDIVPLLTEEPSHRWTVHVGGQAQPFDGWSAADMWFATPATATGPHALVLEGRTIDPTWVNLVRLRTLQPYLDGRRAALERRRYRG